MQAGVREAVRAVLEARVEIPTSISADCALRVWSTYRRQCCYYLRRDPIKHGAVTLNDTYGPRTLVAEKRETTEENGCES